MDCKKFFQVPLIVFLLSLCFFAGCAREDSEDVVRNFSKHYTACVVHTEPEELNKQEPALAQYKSINQNKLEQTWEYKVPETEPTKNQNLTGQKTYEQKQTHVMVVFVHGTVFPVPSIQSFGSTLHTYLSQRKSLKKSFYQCYLDDLKEKFCGQPAGADGLHKIKDPELDPYLSENNNRIKNMTLNQQFAQAYKSVCQESFDDYHTKYSFYTFGWSGRLDQSHRKIWGHRLYHHLTQEIKALTQKLDKNHELKVIILAHSHGGNVVLNLAHAEKIFQQNLSVDQVVLLATPIQSETAKFIYSPVFKKIYNVFSPKDFVQIIDIVSTQDDASDRYFTQEKTGLTLPDNLVQIEMRIDGKAPGHHEFWFWGMGSRFLYRPELSTYPFPIFIFIPTIIRYHKQLQENCDQTNLSVNIKKKNDYYYTFNIQEQKVSLN